MRAIDTQKTDMSHVYFSRSTAYRILLSMVDIFPHSSSERLSTIMAKAHTFYIIVKASYLFSHTWVRLTEAVKGGQQASK
jgi:hypothetical protein